MVYLGDYDPYSDEESHFTRFVVPNLGTQLFERVWTFNPQSLSLDQFKGSNKIIMKRYANIERVKEAEIIGILIGTVVCDNYMAIINQIKRDILKAGKKFYEVLVGKINEPKLKNFQLIDLYILVACPEQSIIEFKKFNTHCVTPHEAFMALRPELFLWECKIMTEFQGLLSRINHNEDDS